MSERVTITTARTIAIAVNAMLERAGAPRRVYVEGRYGHVGLDEITPAGAVVRTIAAGSSREVCMMLRGMRESLWMLEANQ